MTRAVYHAGERRVQHRAGTGEIAERMSRTLRPEIPAVARDFLARQTAVVIGAAGVDGRLWTTLLTGPPGFARATGTDAVDLDAVPAPGDPLSGAFETDAPAGAIAIDFAKRRRMRLNGRGTRAGRGLRLTLDQVYANCPKHIQSREPVTGTPTPRGTPVRTTGLTDDQRALIGAADTFFVATADADGNADCSHRGGNPGFVRVVAPERLDWPDYAGNGMFNTLGNLEVDPAAGLLFVDWASGRCLQLTGRARTAWDADRFAGIPGAQRLVSFEVDAVVDTAGGTPMWTAPSYSPANPEVRAVE